MLETNRKPALYEKDICLAETVLYMYRKHLARKP